MDLVIFNQSCNYIPHISCLTLLTTKETWDLVFVYILVLNEITVHLYSLCLKKKKKKKKKNQKIIKILELQGFNYVTVWVNCLWKRSQILCERVTDSLHFCFAQDGVGESNSCIRTFWRWWVLLFVYSLLWKIGFCALAIWALLDFRIQFNELLNSVTDKNENKNPYTIWCNVNTCTINDFLFTVLTWILYTMKSHVFEIICGTGAKKKKKKKSFVSPYPTDPLKMTLTQNMFFIETNGFFSFTKIYILQLEELSVLFCYF